MSQTVTKFRLAPVPLSLRDRVAVVWRQIGMAWRVATTQRQLSQLDGPRPRGYRDFPRTGAVPSRAPDLGPGFRQLPLT